MQALERFRQSALFDEAANAWRWWISELEAMVPARLKARMGGRRYGIIYPGQTQVEIERLVDGLGERLVETNRLESFDADNWAELDALTHDCRLRLVLRPPDVYVIELTLPRAARNRLKSAVALQLLERAPLDPGHLVWAHEIVELRDRDMIVRVAMARTARIAALQQLFDDQDMRVPPISAETDAGLIKLAGGEERPRDPERRLAKRAYLGAVLLLLSMPITTWAGATILRSLTESKIVALGNAIEPKVRAERQWRSEEALRKSVAPLSQLPLASSALEELAKRLPVTSYAESVEQAADRSLLLTLSTSDAEKSLSALARSTVLPKASLVDQTSSSEAGRTTATYRTLPR